MQTRHISNGYHLRALDEYLAIKFCMKAEIEKHGLILIGKWARSDKHSSVGHLKNNISFGINFDVFPEWKNKTNVTYAFVVNGRVDYIGESTKGISSRFVGYRYGNPLVTDTDNRVKINITKCLNEGVDVEIWAVSHFVDFVLPNGEKINVPISKPLEEHLIHKLSPNWNKKNLKY